MSEKHTYRKFTAKHKAEIVLAGLRGDKPVRDVCREHGIAETLYYSWREKLLEAGQAALNGKDERRAEKEMAKEDPRARAGPGSQDLRARDRGGSIAGVGVMERVAFARELVGRGRRVAAVARTLQISRQAIYRTPKPRRAPQRRPPAGEVEEAIVETAKQNPTDGYRMVWALTRRKLGRAVNRKRVLRVMREQRLIQRRRREPRRRRPGFFRVERLDQLWHLDLTSVWVAEHGWCYLMAAIDCCTREITAWQLELRCRADESIALIERAAGAHGIVPGQLVLGTDNGSAFTARRFKAVLSGLGIAHRRGGYRDPESQAFIESWFGKLKEREVWRNEYETLEEARTGIGAYVERYHHRPHSSLDYRTPKEVRRTWEDAQEEREALRNQAA